MKIQWRNISVVFNDGKIVALDGVSGNAEQGKMLALMGSTGSGKSTLLNSLSGRGPISRGSVRFGEEGWVWSKALKRHVGFVEQDDIVYPLLTVRQSLSISAQLRLPQEWSRDEILGKVEEVISLLRLDKCADTLIGDQMTRGVSGGERKRCCIAQELLTSPKVICCDELTSGLDSSTALLVVELLKELAVQQELTIVTSIHQPSSQVYAAFNDLIVLNQGKTVYNGQADKIAEEFSSLGYPCPAGFNISDWFMEVVVNDKLRAEDRLTLEKRYGPASLPRFTSKGIEKKEQTSQMYHQNYLTQVSLLARREWLMMKDNLWSTPNFVTHTGNAIILGMMYLRTGFSEADIFSRFTACFIMLMMWLFFPLMSAQAVLPAYKLQLKKELAVGAYRLSAWFIVRTSMVMLGEYIWPFFNVTIFYWLAGVNDNFGDFVGIYLAISLTHLVFHSMGLFIATSTSPTYSMTVSLLVITFMFGYSGVFVPLDQIPSFLRWVPIINPLQYSFGLVLHQAFDPDKEYHCNSSDDGSIFPESCPSPGYITREEILEQYGLEKLSTGLCLGVLVAIGTFLRVCSFFIFYREMLPDIKVIKELEATRSVDLESMRTTQFLPEEVCAKQPKDSVQDYPSDMKA